MCVVLPLDDRAPLRRELRVVEGRCPPPRALPYSGGHDRHHPFRPLAHRPAACRQHPHRAAQLAVRAREWRAVPAADRRYRCRAQRGALRRRDPRRSRLARADARCARSGSRRGSRCTRRGSPRWSRAGRVYPAYETAQELDLKRKIQLGRGLPPIYDRAALALSDADRARAGGGGRAAALALQARSRRADRVGRSDPRAAAFRSGDDERSGDPPRRRIVALHAAVARSTMSRWASPMSCAARIMCRTPRCSCRCSRRWARRRRAFAHEALLTGSEGKLSKRLGSLGVEHFREAGIEPQAVRRAAGADRDERPGRADRRCRAADRELRLRALRPRAGAVRRGRTGGAQRADRPPADVRRGRGAACPRGWARRRGRRCGRTW